MRSKVSTIIILVSIFLLAFVIFKGVQIGNFRIEAISTLISKNDELVKKIEEAKVITSINYPESEQKLEELFEQYLVQKQKYEGMSGISGDLDGEKYETKQYDIGYLWRVIGKYATNRGMKLGIDVQKNKTGNSIYNFNFTVEGNYVNISQFITDIENNSDLYFRVYDFNMISEDNGKTIKATFTVKGINVDKNTITG